MNKNVGASNETMESVLAFNSLQVQNQTLLVSVRVKIECAAIDEIWRSQRPAQITFGAFYLDNLGPQSSEQHPAIGSGQYLAQVQYTDSR